MPSVFLRSVAEALPSPRPQDLVPVRILRRSAANDSRGRHTLIADPADAEIIIFAEAHDDQAASGPFLESVLRDEVYRHHGARCYVHCGLDFTVPRLPGIYPSLERRWGWKGWVRSGCYLIEPNPFLAAAEPGYRSPKRLLASFLGTCGAVPVRHALVSLGERPGFHARDTGPGFIGALRAGDEARVRELKQHFVEITGASRFALCPRGVGASSIRLFEAMELGVAPVILSDDWREPHGPRWAEFSLRVPEKDARLLPEILRGHEARAEEMGRLARKAWEEHYAPAVLFDTVVQDCLEIARERSTPSPLLRAGARVQALRPVHARRLVRRWPLYTLARSLLGR